MYELNKVDYLQYLCNKYGDFYVQTHMGDNKRTTWKSVQECWEDDKLMWRLRTATDRTPLPCEIIIDFDPKKKESRVDFIVRTYLMIKKIMSMYNKVKILNGV